MSRSNVQNESDDELPERKDHRGHNISNVSATGNTRMLLGDHHQTVHNTNYYSAEASFFRAKPQEERNKLLVRAALEGQLPRLRYLIDAGADLDAQFPYTRFELHEILPIQTWRVVGYGFREGESTTFTALGAAVLGNHVQCVTLLLDRGADINQKILRGDVVFDSPLLISLHGCSDEVTESLLNRGAALEDKLLSLAVRLSTPIGILQMMIDKGIDVNYYNETANVSPALVEAVLRERPKRRRDGRSIPDYQQSVVDFLLSSDANANARTMLYDHRVSSNSTPLIIASSKGSTRIVSSLLKFGADANVDHQDSRGYTALMRLYDRDCGADWITTALHQSGPHVAEILELLLESGADVRLCNNSGMNVLMLAARNNHEEAAKLILRHKQEIDAQDNFGMTALMHLLDNWHKPISRALLRLLLSHGASVDSRNKQGKPALLLAARMCDMPTLRMLFTAGADGAAVDRKGRNTLLLYLSSFRSANRMRVGWKANLALLAMLDEAGIDFKQMDIQNRTALMLAAKTGSDALVKYFLDRGDSDVNGRDKLGKSALTYAAEKGHKSSVKLLRSRGAGYVAGKDSRQVVRNVEAIMSDRPLELPKSLRKRPKLLRNLNDSHSTRSLSGSDRSGSDIPSEDSISEESTPESPYSFANSSEDAPCAEKRNFEDMAEAMQVLHDQAKQHAHNEHRNSEGG